MKTGNDVEMKSEDIYIEKEILVMQKLLMHRKGWHQCRTSNKHSKTSQVNMGSVQRICNIKLESTSYELIIKTILSKPPRVRLFMTLLGTFH